MNESNYQGFNNSKNEDSYDKKKKELEIADEARKLQIAKMRELLDASIIEKENRKKAEKGYAYEKNGSVYFDIEAYKKGGHMYAKLIPQDKNQNLEELQEAEGVLSKDNAGEKKNKGDFALWKTSKKDEPFWDSPWGKGRPGWHIECSVMSSSIFGNKLDIHSGGIDLRFPHHDNEIAQTEAHDDSKQYD